MKGGVFLNFVAAAAAMEADSWAGLAAPPIVDYRRRYWQLVFLTQWLMEESSHGEAFLAPKFPARPLRREFKFPCARRLARSCRWKTGPGKP
jgi:hypothetical protein